MCRTEFDAHCEHRTIVTVARRPPPIAVTEEEDMPVDESPATAAQSVLICGTYLPPRGIRVLTFAQAHCREAWLLSIR